MRKLLFYYPMISRVKQVFRNFFKVLAKIFFRKQCGLIFLHAGYKEKTAGPRYTRSPGGLPQEDKKRIMAESSAHTLPHSKPPEAQAP